MHKKAQIDIDLGQWKEDSDSSIEISSLSENLVKSVPVIELYH